MSKLINLVLLYGGKSGEHEISLISAASVLTHLDSKKYHIIPVAIDKEGLFHLHDYQDLLAYPEKLPVSTEKSKPLANLFLNGRLVFDMDVIFPVIHGPLYEDGCLQGFLELADVAYVGCDVLSSSIGMDKDMSRRVACGDGLEAARYRVLSCHSSLAARKNLCEQTALELGWPLFVKPCAMGSSVGIHKAKNMPELLAAVEDALRFDEEILIESFIEGREIEVAVLENAQDHAHPKVSVVGEICVHHRDGFYSYAAKYLESNQTELIIPASLNSELTQKVQAAAAQVFTRLKCRGLARVDFFVDDKKQCVYFNEVNTLPGFTSISMYPKLWEASGLSYPDLLDELISLAQRAYQSRQHLVTNYQ